MGPTRAPDWNRIMIKSLPLTTKFFLLPAIAVLLTFAGGIQLAEWTGLGQSEVAMTEVTMPKQRATTEVAAQVLIERHEAKGLKCQTEPTLTDTIVFTHMNGDAETVTFDEALKLGKAGAGYVRGYCS